MIQTGFESRVKIQQIIDNQLPEFILDESPKASEFLKQYYISQEYQGGPTDIAENLDQYLKLDNLTPEVVVDNIGLTTNISAAAGIAITVTSTKGFPPSYGLLKIDNEIITYTGITTNTFTGCIRGFSGITSYHSIPNQEELVFSTSESSAHTSGSSVQNLSSLFLKEFYKKLKYALTPGLENSEFVPDLNIGNFIKNSRSFYQSKGTNESFRILFNVLYGITPTVINLEDFLIKPSGANYVKRTIISVERISGDPSKLVGQTIKKSTDPSTSASVSEVEIFTKKNVKYYKLSLFVGNDNRSSIEGNFSITPNTKCLENISVGSSVISVDSTIGFSGIGTIVSGNNTITYTDKSINQFLGCSGVIETINVKDNIRSNETYYGYEDGNVNKKVEFRIAGVISKFVPISDPFKVVEGQEIIVKNLGDEIKNPSGIQSQKQIFANSWIYNTSSRYQIEFFGSGGSLTLKSFIDKSSLKEGDEIEILERGTGNVVYPQAGQNAPYVSTQINLNSKIVLLNNFTTDGWYSSGLNYDLRRKVNKASSAIVPIEYGNNVILSDIQNVYNENDEYMYVASNSLPSNNRLLDIPYAYEITKNINNAFAVGLSGLDDNNYYNIINCSAPVPFITGDRIYYSPESTPISGLTTGYYYVEVLSPNNTIKLYSSLSFVGGSSNILFEESDFGSSHKFLLYSQKSSTIKPQKILKKFPLNLNIQNGTEEETVPGSTGMLINGVEIKNYKLNDRVYYGPLESVKVLNGGENYDVINPPLIEISSGLGITALVQPVVSGSINKVFVDVQDFDIDSIISIGVTGGNGNGAVFEPIIKERIRDIYFDGRLSTYGGGVDYTYDTITFLKDHYLSNGQQIVYNSNGNASIGIGQYSGSNSNQNLTLVNNGTYYIKVQNSKTIILYPTLSDYNSGINTIGFTNVPTSGFHKFSIVLNKKTLSEIKVINGGSGYQNRKLIVKPSGISTANYSINFNNHGFNDGDIVEYDYEITSIAGISTTNKYYVLKLNENSFRLCDAGASGTDKSNYNQKKYIKFSYPGYGYQYFKYPDISVSVVYSKSGISSEPTQVGSLVLNPSVKGRIIDMYLYEPGSNYGSDTILNLHKRPLISIKNGKEARLKPIIVNGVVDSINIQYGGVEYYSTPDLVVVDNSKSGSGADLRATVTDGRISAVSIINPGIGYSSGSTYIQVISSGKNAKFDLNVRSLRVNANKKFGDELFIDNGDGLQYSVCGYLQTLRESFKDIGSNHSPIIGWAYDGNPIYGSYGYSDPSDINSGLKQLQSGYTLDVNNISNRPSISIFPSGFFVEDYVYKNSGDLDENNGRFTKTPEYPNGVYAYFAPVDFGTFTSQFPYFIGNSYRSIFIKENITLNQSFDFNNSNLVRNTLPYKVSDYYADNDFIIEFNDIQKQKSVVNSVSTGYVDEIDILNSGSDYKINDLFKSNDTNTGGGGLTVKVSSIKGKDIINLSTSVKNYNNSIFTWKNENQIKVSILPKHDLSNNDNVIVSGFSTFLSELNGSYTIGVTSYFSNLIKDVPSQSSGVTTDIYVSQIPELVSIGSSIVIESETLSVIQIFKDLNILKVKRGLTGVSHTTTTQINFIPDSFIINQKTNYFDSSINDKVYFNPKKSVGVGTQPGITSSINGNLGINSITVTVPTQGIYIQNHPFKNNQQVVFSKLNGSNPIAISTSPTGFPADQIPSSGNSQIVYLTSKNNNVIGIKTGLDYPEVFFLNDGSDDYNYSLTSNYNQILGQVSRIETLVSLSTYHELSNGDKITLKVNPNLSVGIGTSASIYVKRDANSGNILINSLGFSSTGINTETNTITINSHKLNTGDKVLYSTTDTLAYAKFQTLKYIGTQESASQEIFFKPDGTRMYVLGNSGDDITYYTLSTPWDVSSASYASGSQFSVSSQEVTPTGLYFKPDGTKFYVCGQSSDKVHQYTCETAWDLSSASYDNIYFSISSQEINSTGIEFNSDGTKFYIIGTTSDRVYQYACTTPWNLSTAYYTNVSFSVTSKDSSPTSIRFSYYGDKMFMLGSANDKLYIYGLTIPWDISTLYFIDSFSVASEETAPSGLYVKSDQTAFYVNGTTSDNVNQYEIYQYLNGKYYIFKVDDDNIKLSETYYNSVSIPPITVNIVSIGGTSQQLSLINPQIKVVKNNNLVFNLSDSTLSGYNFKLYYDKDFKNEFVSTGSTSTFVLTGIGTIGISSTAALTLNYSNEFPTRLFYNLEKSGYISSSDKEVSNYSEILFINSDYNNNYNVSGIGSTSFRIFLEKNPEKLTYSQNECDTLEYSTTSLSAKGPINKVNIVSGGTGYKKLPVFNKSNSENGSDAYIIAKSKTIGNPKEVVIIDEGFDYSCDKTLEPTAYISPRITLNNSNTISNIIVLNGGKNYTNAPSIVIVDPNTGEKIDSGILEAKLTSNSITSVEIKQKPKGLPLGSKLFSVNNDNGISIQKIQSSSSGIFTCLITTPTLGFTTAPFNVGDKVFIEGIEKDGSSGSGFNSEDYGYQFFKVSNYDSSSVFDKVEINVSGLTTNTGIAKTSLYSFANIINYNNYPNFEIVEESLSFIVGEKIISNGIERDLYVETSDKDSITVTGKYELSVGEVIFGIQSATIATINQIENNSGKFKIDFNLNKDIGWTNDVGKLNLDNQFISDNDYYQNLSYTIKSPITYNELKVPVNNLVHTIGLKNFSDTGITSTAKFQLSNTEEYINIIKTLIQENRVDAINNFDLVQDVDINGGISKFLKLKNKKLSNYVECNTNLVLKIDDIHNEFSNILSSASVSSNIFKIDSQDDYNRLLIRVTDTSNTKIQLTELIVLNNSSDSFILQKGSLFNVGAGLTSSNGQEYGTFSSTQDVIGNRYIQFIPTNPYDYDYDIKFIKNKFNTSTVGVASTSVGFVNLISSGLAITSGITSSIISIPTYKIESLCANVEIINEMTGKINFVELYLSHDGTNTHISEYSFDSDSAINSYSSNIDGLFAANISSGLLTLSYTNTSENNIKLKSKIIGIGTVAVGMGTYRFKLPGQLNGYERTAKYESRYSSNVSAASSVISLNKNDFNAIKSLVKVGVGTTSSLHQVLLIQDKNDIYVQQSAFLSVGSTTGIGTFGGEYNGNNFSLRFYPDSNISNINILSFNECLYTQIDDINIPPGLYYGNVAESVGISLYNAINGDRINRKDFDLTYGGSQYQIFAKNFDPSDSNVLNPATGEFTIKNHFFSNGEKLIYTPISTYLGIGASAVGIGLTLTSAGIVTNRLPSDVYVIKKSNDTFKLSTRKDYALAGIYVTFTSYGSGNYHQLEMYEKNSKSIITIDNIIQYPLIYTPIKYTLSNNGGQINDKSTIFSLSGISSISPRNILRIDNEFMLINNVGFGTTNVGPITNTGSIPLVQVNRGSVGSSATSHTDTIGIATIYKGSYNIVGNKIFFAESPRGNPQIIKDSSYLDYQTSSFNGRVYLRQDYSTNKVYDDISSEFTGVGRTFALKVQGNNAVGLGTSGGNGILLINGIYQTPTTDNNPSNNFRITENGSTSSNVIFSGITDENGDIITSPSDINQNQLPRGGLIVSIGSSGGLGYAPLVGASVTAVVSGGSIVSVGLGSTDILGSGYNNIISIGVSVYQSGHSGTPAVINASVGAGGTLGFSIINGGTGYTNPKIFVSPPSYQNLEITGVYRPSIGNTTTSGKGLLLDIEVGASSTTGIGSTYFEVKSFNITRAGYEFNIGDVFTPVGLVTDKRLASPLSQFKLTVIDTFSDSFAAWQFGEFDFIDSIKIYQDGIRTRFPLYYNSELISFQKSENSEEIDMNALLFIVINGVIQDPGVAYNFEGGTSFVFTTPPKKEDKVAILFYRGTKGSDSSIINADKSLKKGDKVQVKKNNDYIDTLTQNERTIFDLTYSDKFETNLYGDQGVDDTHYKPLTWIKQKIDSQINGEIVYKSRESIEAQVYPAAKVIKDFSSSDTEIFVDNARFFNYENLIYPNIKFDSLIIDPTFDNSNFKQELITNVSVVQGFSGIVTGIGTTAGTNGNTLALKFYLNSSTFSNLNVGYPIYVYNTSVGKGVTSINNSNSAIVGIGTTFLDNIYYIHQFSSSGLNGIITCNVHSTTNIIGITTMSNSSNPIGKFSWGRLSGFTRSNSPISIGVSGKTVDVGLTTFSDIQRRGNGLRSTGSLPLQIT